MSNFSNTNTSEENDFFRKYAYWIVSYTFLSVPTVVGNLLILVSLSRFRDRRSNIHFLIGNLAISDLIVGAFLLPYCVVVDVLKLNSHKYFCLTKASLMVFAIGGSTYGLLLVSIDRFSSVCFPFRYYQILNSKNIIILLVIGWSYVAIVAFLPLTGWNFYDRNLPYGCTVYKVLTPIYQKMMNCNFIAGLSLNLTMYIIVMRIAIKKARQIYTEQSYIHDYRRSARELYKVKTMAMVQGLFAVCWFPYVVIALTLMFTDIPLLHELQYWSVLPGLLNSALNWIIYGYRNKQLGQQMKMYIKCSFRNRVN